MKDSVERDLAVANELGHMADARIKELEAQHAKLVSALRHIAERNGRRECERYSTGIGSCFTHGRRANAVLAAEKCCARCIADAALAAAQETK